MKKYTIITNDRGTIVEAVCYDYNDNGQFLGRDEKHTVDIPYTPKYRDKLRYHERIANKERYERVLEYIRALEELEHENRLYRRLFGV